MNVGKVLKILVAGVGNTGKTTVGLLIQKSLIEAGFANVKFSSTDEILTEKLIAEKLAAFPDNQYILDLPIEITEQHLGAPLKISGLTFHFNDNDVSASSVQCIDELSAISAARQWLLPTVSSDPLIQMRFMGTAIVNMQYQLEEYRKRASVESEYPTVFCGSIVTHSKGKETKVENIYSDGTVLPSK
jgi:hypothetical protein